jgi:hypothetical protein
MAMSKPPTGTLGRWALFGSAGLVLIALILLSGAANIVVWWMTGEGWTRFWYTGVGLACEIWAALGLVIITSRFVRGEWARGAIAVALWIPAVAFNAYTVHRFLEMGDETHERAAITLQADRSILQQEITDLQQRIDAANITRSIAAIETELSLAPPEATQLRRRLSTELQLARDVEGWRTQVTTKRQQLAQGAGAAHAGVSDRLNNEGIMIGMAIWIEAMKALCLFVLRGRVKQTPPAAAAGKGVAVEAKKPRAPRIRVEKTPAPAVAAATTPEPASSATPTSSDPEMAPEQAAVPVVLPVPTPEPQASAVVISLPTATEPPRRLKNRKGQPLPKPSLQKRREPMSDSVDVAALQRMAQAVRRD